MHKAGGVQPEGGPHLPPSPSTDLRGPESRKSWPEKSHWIKGGGKHVLPPTSCWRYALLSEGVLFTPSFPGEAISSFCPLAHGPPLPPTAPGLAAQAKNRWNRKGGGGARVRDTMSFSLLPLPAQLAGHSLRDTPSARRPPTSDHTWPSSASAGQLRRYDWRGWGQLGRGGKSYCRASCHSQQWVEFPHSPPITGRMIGT